MGKSARVLGHELGLTAPEVNFALAEAGLLEGAPQRWRVTEEGKKYATEERRWNGVGGYQQYVVDYEVRTWEDEVLEALDLDAEKKQRAREAASAARRQAREAKAAPPVAEPVEPSRDASSTDINTVVIVIGGLALAGGVVYGIYKLAPRVKRWWDERRSPSDGAEP